MPRIAKTVEKEKIGGPTLLDLKTLNEATEIKAIDKWINETE